MPPKSKKEQEEQAKRLEEQRKKREEEEARLEEQRKKYLPEVISTGLFLPVSNQLLIQFSGNSIQFVDQKLKDSLKQQYPEVLNSSRLNFLLKQLHYLIKDSLKIFGNPKQGSNNQKHRIFIGIMLTILLNNDEKADGNNKDKNQDSRKAKDLVTLHCRKNQGVQSLSQEDGILILNYAKENYFGKFSIIKYFDKFTKRETQAEFPVYIEVPNIYYNDEHTVFTDLLKHEQKQPVPS